jgi:hypothetical protein
VSHALNNGLTSKGSAQRDVYPHGQFNRLIVKKLDRIRKARLARRHQQKNALAEAPPTTAQLGALAAPVWWYKVA